jgi:hypothetical protein
VLQPFFLMENPEVVQGGTSFLSPDIPGSLRSQVPCLMKTNTHLPRMSTKSHTVNPLQDLVVIVSSPGVVTMTDTEQDHHPLGWSVGQVYPSAT